MTDEQLAAIEARANAVISSRSARTVSVDDVGGLFAASRDALVVISELRAAREKLKAVEGLSQAWRERAYTMALRTQADSRLACADELEATLRGGK